MAASIDFDDLRFLLAVAESGSTLAAARRLGVSQSTVARRIAALEASLGRQLFDKRRDGYRLTADGESLRPEAEAVETAMRAFALAADGLSRAVGGTVRFTTNEVMAGLFVPELVSRLKARHPGIGLEVDVTPVLRDLGAGEADIALRAAPPPQQAGLVGVRLAEDHWSLYCARTYAERHGAPSNVEELSRHCLIGLVPDGRHDVAVAWAERHFPPGNVVVRQNSIPSAFASIASGIGVGFYSDILALGRDDIVLCFRPDIPPSAEVWLLTHERLRHAPRIRAVMEETKALVAGRIRANGQ
ncbi:LysR family transcriptional regulator [Martelella radicis]|uniref:DNA-binding transcriptional LysR family regulator n=1 Tax=Martelella radicis TaxID=1397476 RepID=A0A7W6KLK2_9HYPH|nr:LysR family transcriptional regulator [Martelella radicis]MBB4123496.1 DNA-binding transcriptional LysR family regulator [Martelella radicis]